MPQAKSFRVSQTRFGFRLHRQMREIERKAQREPERERERQRECVREEIRGREL